MKYKLPWHSRLAYFSLLFILIISLLMPASISTAAPALEIVVEDPQLHPPDPDCPQNAWYSFENDRGHMAYLTLNVSLAGSSTNSGEWHPAIPQAGYYRVEAYIAAHDPIYWCISGKLKEHDTTNAQYLINHAGVISTRTVSQYPLSNQWLDLGEYYFTAGNDGYVRLTDLTGETAYSTTVSFSAMRFTYTRAFRPQTYLPLVHHSDPSGRPPPNVGVIQAQGFDVCGLPSISTMQTWWNASPYSFYGLYLGGIQLPSQCIRADSAWVKAVHKQGWSFIPTWVGPQAPCSLWSQKMSSDPAVSYQQGRQEAEAASTRAASLGLTNYGLGGTVIYYDMEAFGGASLECRQAAASFMNGWVERLHELGNVAGGYGAHNSYVEDWATLAHVPEDVWAASWYTDAYDPYASVYSIPWLQGLWTNHQRLRQYAGGHHDSWGGIGIVIDSDVADGMVAMPPSKVLTAPIVLSSPTIEDSEWLTADQGWLVSQQRLYLTSDRGKNWTDISPAAVQLAYFTLTGQAWAISPLDVDKLVINHSVDWGKTWKSYELNLPAEDWQPLQIQFTSAASGWLVLQMVTSQAFNYAILLKTSDSGHTWQSYVLPTAGKITFISQTDGWLTNEERDVFFHTQDGGMNWQPARPDDFPLANSPLPSSATLSGWQSGGLGWAVTSDGSCQGEKGTLGFTCQVDNRLWQSLDSGINWDVIPLPNRSPNTR